MFKIIIMCLKFKLVKGKVEKFIFVFKGKESDVE